MASESLGLRSKSMVMGDGARLGARFAVAAALALGAVVACSSSGPPAMTDLSALTTVSGTVGPATLKTASAIARIGVLATTTPNKSTATVRGLRILFSSKLNTCTASHAANSVLFAVTIRGGAVGAGTYTLEDPASRSLEEGDAVGDFDVVDTACRATFNQGSTGGTITIATTNPRVTGYLDVTFPTGTIRGAFDADLCPALEAHDGIGATDCVP